MSEFSCNTVRDMLPLYVDNIVSDDTRAIVEEHLTSCDACRKEYENMKNAFVLPADGDAKQLKRFKGAWKKKKRLVALTAVIATILALCIGYGIFDHFAYREEIAVNGAVYARTRETPPTIRGCGSSRTRDSRAPRASCACRQGRNRAASQGEACSPCWRRGG